MIHKLDDIVRLLAQQDLLHVVQELGTFVECTGRPARDVQVGRREVVVVYRGVMHLALAPRAASAQGVVTCIVG